MRIVVKNIQNLQEQQVQTILGEWITASNDSTSYYTTQNGLGCYYGNVANEVLPAMAAEFGIKAQEKLGATAALYIASVQTLTVASNGKCVGSGLKDDPQYKEYLKNPETWSLSAVQSKQKRSKKTGGGTENPKSLNIAKKKSKPVSEAAAPKEAPEDSCNVSPSNPKPAGPKKRKKMSNTNPEEPNQVPSSTQPPQTATKSQEKQVPSTQPPQTALQNPPKDQSKAPKVKSTSTQEKTEKAKPKKKKSKAAKKKAPNQPTRII